MDFVSNGALPNDGALIIKWVHGDSPGLLPNTGGFRIGFIVGVATGNEVHVRASNRADSIHLLSRRGLRNHDTAIDFQIMTPLGHPLGMITGARCNHPTLAFLSREGKHEV